VKYSDQLAHPRLFPASAEVLGLLGLMRLHLARAAARFDAAGELVLLRDQDRSRWNRQAITEATRLLEQAAALKQPGPYQLQPRSPPATLSRLPGRQRIGRRSSSCTTCSCASSIRR